jgi:hypothetical protein
MLYEAAQQIGTESGVYHARLEKVPSFMIFAHALALRVSIGQDSWQNSDEVSRRHRLPLRIEMDRLQLLMNTPPNPPIFFTLDQPGAFWFRPILDHRFL